MDLEAYLGRKKFGPNLLCLDCVRWCCSRLSLALSPRCSGQWHWIKTSGWCTSTTNHWSRKSSSSLPTALSIPPPKLLPDLKRGQKKAKSGPDINVGNWSGQVKRGPQLAGFYPAAHLLAAPAPVAPLRCFNPPAAAGRNSRAAPVTAKTSRGDGHWSVGGQQLAEADV